MHKIWIFIFVIVLFITCSDSDPHYYVNELDTPVVLEIHFSPTDIEIYSIAAGATIECYPTDSGGTMNALIVLRTNGILIYSNTHANTSLYAKDENHDGGCMGTERPYLHINEFFLTNTNWWIK